MTLSTHERASLKRLFDEADDERRSRFSTGQHCFGTVPGCKPCRTDEVGCVGEHHGAGCEHPTCTDCGEFLDSHEDTCPECGRVEAG